MSLSAEQLSHLPLWISVVLGSLLIVCILFRVIRRGNSGRRRGREGERLVRKMLKRLPRRNTIVLNDLMFESAVGRRRAADPAVTSRPTIQIDHVVVSTKGIFVIETKHYRGAITGHENSQFWQQKFLMSAKSFYNPLLQNASHIKGVRRLLKDYDESCFVSVIVFTDAWSIDITAEDRIVERNLLPDRREARTLDPERRVSGSWWRRRRGVMLDERKIVVRLRSLAGEIRRRKEIFSREDIHEIAEILRNADIRNAPRRHEHVGYVRKIRETSMDSIRRGMCPRCGGSLVVRRGRTGEFYGCNRYPECRFSCPRLPEN